MGNSIVGKLSQRNVILFCHILYFDEYIGFIKMEKYVPDFITKMIYETFHILNLHVNL